MTKALSVEELLRCSVLNNSSLVAGPESPATVSFVCVNELTVNGQNRTRYLEPPNDLHISNYAGVWISPWIPSYTLELMLAQLKLQGVSVIVLVPAGNEATEQSADFRASTRELARKLAITLIVLHDQNNSTAAVAASLYSYLKSDLINRSANIVSFSRAIGANDPTPGHIVSQLQQHLNAKVAAVNSLGMLLAGTVEKKTDLREIATPEPLISTEPDTTWTWVSVPVPPLLKEESPQVWLIAEFSATAASFELDGAKELMELAALSLVRWLTHQRFENEHFQSAKSAIVSQLAMSGGVVPDHVVSQALSVGWNLNGWHTLVSVRMTQKSAGQDVGSMLQAALAPYGYNTESTPYIDHWLLWETRRTQPTRADYKSFVSSLDSIRPPEDAGIVFGIARPRLGAEGFAKSITEAEDFVRQASTSKGRRRIVDAQESLATQLIRNTLHDPAMVRPSLKFLRRLVEEDATYLRETLNIYLERESNLADTARILRVHRNTVIKRLEKVAEMLDASLDDTDTKFALRIALRVIDISLAK